MPLTLIKKSILTKISQAGGQHKVSRKSSREEEKRRVEKVTLKNKSEYF